MEDALRYANLERRNLQKKKKNFFVRKNLNFVIRFFLKSSATRNVNRQKDLIKNEWNSWDFCKGFTREHEHSALRTPLEDQEREWDY